MAELVAGHSQDNEPLAGVSLVELVHLGVIPGGRTSERRDVLDKDHLPSQGGEFERFSRQQVCRELVEVSRHIVLLVTLVGSAAPYKLLQRCLVSLVFLGDSSREGQYVCQESSRPVTLPLVRPLTNVTGREEEARSHKA